MLTAFTYVWTVISTFTFEVLSSERTSAITVSRKQAFKFPHVHPERGACCGNQYCRVQPTSSLSSSVPPLVISGGCLGIQFPTPQCVLSDRFLPSVLSPWRVLLEVWHSCITRCVYCLDVSHFIVWNSSETVGYETLQELIIKGDHWEGCPISLLTCSGVPWTFTCPSALLLRVLFHTSKTPC